MTNNQLCKKKFKGYKGSGKLFISVSKDLLKKIPAYYMIELDLSKITPREREDYSKMDKRCITSIIRRKLQ